jgi:hypothetical protein
MCSPPLLSKAESDKVEVTVGVCIHCFYIQSIAYFNCMIVHLHIRFGC